MRYHIQPCPDCTTGWILGKDSRGEVTKRPCNRCLPHWLPRDGLGGGTGVLREWWTDDEGNVVREYVLAREK